MAEDNNKRRVLYDAISGKYDNLGTFEEFDSKLNDENKVKTLYDQLTTDGYDLGDYDSFKGKVGASVQQNQPVTTTTQVQQPGMVTLTNGQQITQDEYDKRSKRHNELTQKYGANYVEFEDGSAMSQADYKALLDNHKKAQDDYEQWKNSVRELPNGDKYIGLMEALSPSEEKRSASFVHNIPIDYANAVRRRYRGASDQAIVNSWWNLTDEQREYYVEGASNQFLDKTGKIMSGQEIQFPYRAVDKQLPNIRTLIEQQREMNARMLSTRKNAKGQSYIPRTKEETESAIAEADNVGVISPEQIDEMSQQPVDRYYNDTDTFAEADELNAKYEAQDKERARLRLEAQKKASENIDAIQERLNANKPKAYDDDNAPVGVGMYGFNSYAKLPSYETQLHTEAQRAIDNAREIEKQYYAYKNGSGFWENTARGFKDGVFDLDTWTMGLMDLEKVGVTKSIVSKLDRGEKLSQAEQDCFDALVYEFATSVNMADELGYAYKAANTTGKSLPFLVQMLASGGASAAVSKGAGKLATKIAEAAMKKKFVSTAVRYAVNAGAKIGMGKKIAVTMSGKAINTRLGEFIGNKTINTTVGNLIGRGIQGVGKSVVRGAVDQAIWGMPSMIADAVQRHEGNKTIANQAAEMFRDANLAMYGEEGVKWSEALIKAYISSTAEYATEALGDEVLDPLTNILGNALKSTVKSAFGAGGRRFVNSALMTNADKALSALSFMHSNSNWAKAAKSTAKAFRQNGLFNEYLEELVNNVISYGLGDMTFDQLTSGRQNLETILGLAWTSGAFTTASAIHAPFASKDASAKLKKSREMMLASSDNKDAAKLFMDSLNGKSFDEICDAYEQYASTIDPTTQGAEEHKRAALDYAKNFAIRMGIKATEFTQSLEEGGEEEKSPIQQVISAAQEEGEMALDGEQRKQISANLDECEEQLAGFVGEYGDLEQYVTEMFGATSDEQMENIKNDPSITLEQKRLLTNYIIELEKYKSMMGVANAQVQSRVDKARKQVEQITYQQEGDNRVITVLWGKDKNNEGKRGYVVGGDFYGNDNTATIQVIGVDGSRLQISKNQLTILNDTNADEYGNLLTESIRRAAIDELSAEIDNNFLKNGAENPMQPGQHVMVQYRGSYVPATITAVAAGANGIEGYDVKLDSELDGKTDVKMPANMVFDEQSYQAQVNSKMMAQQALAQQGSKLASALGMEEQQEEKEPEMVTNPETGANDYIASGVDNTVAYLGRRLTTESQIGVADANINDATSRAEAAQNELNRLQSEQPDATKFLDPDLLAEAQQQWEEQMNSAQAEYDNAVQSQEFWQSVKAKLTGEAAQASTEETTEAPAEEQKPSFGIDTNGTSISELADKLSVSENILKTLDAIAKKIGVTVRFYDMLFNEQGQSVEGGDYAKTREVRISIYELLKSNKPIRFLIGHEFTHQLRNDENKRGEIENFMSEIKKVMDNDVWNYSFASMIKRGYLNLFQGELQRMGVPNEAIAEAGKLILRKVAANESVELIKKGQDTQGLSEEAVAAYNYIVDGIQEEVTADMAGAVFMDNTFISKASGLSSGTIQKIVNMIDSVKEFLMDMFGISESDIDKAKNAWLNALENAQKLEIDVEKVMENRAAAAKNSMGNALAINDGGTPKFSLRTWEDGGRQALDKYLSKQVKEKKISETEKNNLLSEMDRLATDAKDIADGNPNGLFGQWCWEEVRTKDGVVPIMHALKKNAEYALNIDFSTVCKKRQVIDHIFNKMINDGYLQHENLSNTDIARINQIIQKHGLEIACGICFVDSKRYNAYLFADGFLNKFNPIVESLMPGKEIAGFNYSNDSKFTNDGKTDLTQYPEVVNWFEIFTPIKTNKDALKNYALDWSGCMEILRPKFEAARSAMRGKDFNEKFTKYWANQNKDAVYEQAKEKAAKTGKKIKAKADYKAADIIKSGFLPKPTANDKYAYAVRMQFANSNVEETAVMRLSENPSMRMLAKAEDFIASQGWTNILQQNPILESLWNQQKGAAGARPNESNTQYNPGEVLNKNVSGDIYDIGGYRMQSFSDFIGRMYFDYLQAFADLSARQLPGHAYTKEPSFVKIFGMMGMKINMSLVSDVDTTMPRDYAGLTRDENGNITYNFYVTERDAYGNIVKQGQTFPPEVALELQDDERYTANAGTIAVGLSKYHILKLLADDNIRMVIPYHKSGLPHGVALVYHLNEINDYTDTQNTKRADGVKMEDSEKKWVDNFNFVLHQLSIADDKTAAYNAMRTLFVDNYSKDLCSQYGAKDLHAMYDILYNEYVSGKRTGESVTLSENHADENFIATMAANIYRDGCRANGYVPKFDEFAEDHNYFKVLVDFAVYDKNGKYTPQGSIQFNVPDNAHEYIQETLTEDENINEKEREEMAPVIAEIEQYLGNTELRQEQDRIASKPAAEVTDDEKQWMGQSLDTIYNVGDSRNIPGNNTDNGEIPSMDVEKFSLPTGDKYNIEDYGISEKDFRYLGAPYTGSKNRVAKELMHILPDGNRFVDLFSGGGAMTHAAMLTGKYNEFRMNDAYGIGQDLFLDGIAGKYVGYNKKYDKESVKSIFRTPESLLWTTGSNSRSYSDDSRVQSRLNRVNALQKLQPLADRISASKTDYRDVELQPGDVVYADTPYRGTDNSAYGEYGKFDFDAFNEWAQSQDVPVFVSGAIPPAESGWTEIWSKDVRGFDANDQRADKLFVQDKFAGDGDRRGRIKYSMYGTEGMEALAEMTESYEKLDDLDFARDMEKHHKTPLQIKKATGWERGADGKWRYEMMDGDFKDFDKFMGQVTTEGTWYNLEDVWNDDNLFNAYPALREIKVRANKDESVGGSYDGRVIEVTPTGNKDYMRSVMVHEIQHAIQEWEGFAKGGNKSLKDADGNELGYDRYYRLAGEVEARNVQNRMHWSEDAKSRYLATKTEDVARKDQLILMDGILSSYNGKLNDLRKQLGYEKYSLPLMNNYGSVQSAGHRKFDYDAMRQEFEEHNKRLAKQNESNGMSLMDAWKEVKRLQHENFILGLPTAGTYFSGGGLVNQGLTGVVNPVFAAEWDEKIQGVYATNNGSHMMFGDVNGITMDELEEAIGNGRLDYFHASPVCCNFSGMKNDSGETNMDVQFAESVNKVITNKKPRVITIENVPNYLNSESYSTIVKCLEDNGYTFDANVYNSADFGGATSRQRLIVRAVAPGYTLPEVPEVSTPVAWNERIADLIADAPKGTLNATLLTGLANAGYEDITSLDEPILVFGRAANKKARVSKFGEPCKTITASGAYDDRIILPGGDVRQVTSRMLARLMGLDDSYVLPESKKLAHTILGNGVPTELTRAVIAPLIQSVVTRHEFEKVITEQIDAEYMKLAESYDPAKDKSGRKMAQLWDMFNEYVLSQADNGIVPFLAPNRGYLGTISKNAHALKREGNTGNISGTHKTHMDYLNAISTAAEQMAAIIPDDAVLVPMVGHNGTASDESVMLANEIAIRKKHASVHDVLRGAERKSQYKAKYEGAPLSVEDMDMRMEGELPDGRPVFIVDNVIATGTTAEAAVKAIGGGVVLAYDYTSSGNKLGNRATILKDASPITYDDNGNVIPLSQRFNSESRDIRYSLTEKEQEMVFDGEYNMNNIPDLVYNLGWFRRGNWATGYHHMRRKIYDEYGNVNRGEASNALEEYYESNENYFEALEKLRDAENITPAAKEYVQGALDQANGEIEWLRRTVNGENLMWDYPGMEIPQNTEATLNRFNDEQGGVRYSLVEDQSLIDKLDAEEYVIVYRAMLVDDEGNILAPMSSKGLKSKGKDKVVVPGGALGKWEQADEHLEVAVYNDGDEYAHVTIMDDAGGATLVAYNPYIHTSFQMLNDQFAKAWRRPNMVTVRCKVPISELTSGYKADMAKNAVGETTWTDGVVSRRLKTEPRRVLLTRYAMPIEIVPMEEYAESVKAQLEANGVLEQGIPFSNVTPAQRDALVAAGVPITEPAGNGKNANSMAAYEEWKNGGVKYSMDSSDEYEHVREKVKEITGAKGYANNSSYVSGTTESGETYTIRVADHPLTESNLREHEEDSDYVMSIIIDENFNAKDWDGQFAKYDDPNNGKYQVVIKPSEFDEDWFKYAIDRFKKNGDGDLVSDIRYSMNADEEEERPETNVQRQPGESDLEYIMRLAETAKAQQAWDNKHNGYSPDMTPYQANEVRKQESKDVRKRINELLKHVTGIDRRTLNSMLKVIEEVTPKNKERMMNEAERLVQRIEMRETEREVNQLLATKPYKLDPKHMRKGKGIDIRTQEILRRANDTMQNTTLSGLEDEIHKLRSENWHLRYDTTGDFASMSDAEKGTRIAENNQRIEELKNDARAIVFTNIVSTSEAVDEQLNELTAKLSDPDYTPTDEEYAQLHALVIQKTIADSKKIQKEIYELDQQMDEYDRKSREFGAVIRDGQAGEREQEYKDNRDYYRNLATGMSIYIDSVQQDYITKMQELKEKLSGLIGEGRAKWREEVEAEINRRRAIVHEAISDITGGEKRVVDLTAKERKKMGKVGALKSWLIQGLDNFDYMAQQIATRTMGKDSNFYKRFMLGENGVIAAQANYVSNLRNDLQMVNDKCMEIFGKKFEDVMEKMNKEKGIVSIFLESGRRDIEMTKGQALYVYMVNKMADGQPKLNSSGIDEFTMAEIEDFIGEDNKAFADWVQSEFLPALRDRFNSRYQELYHTNMARIANYFPLRIDKTNIQPGEDLTQDGGKGNALAVKTGAIVERTRNALPIDLTTDAFTTLIEHLNEMEDFYAYSPVRRDLNYVMNSAAFRNILNANNNGSYQRLLDTARIAVGTNQVDAASVAVDKLLSWLQAGYVAVNVGFKSNTALKQMLSVPAFFGYSQDPVYLASLVKNIVSIYGKNVVPILRGILHNSTIGLDAVVGNNLNNMMDAAKDGESTPIVGLSSIVEWCLNNVPDFYNRVSEGVSGANINMNEATNILNVLPIILKDFFAGRVKDGMKMNQLVDALTVAIGIKTIYDYKMRKHSENISKLAELEDFNTEEEKQKWIDDETEKMHNQSIMEATIYYNATQQSNNKAFLSPMQVSRTFISRAFSLYKNSPLGYARKLQESLNDIERYTNNRTRANMIDEYAARYIEEYGVGEEDAVKMAREYINNEARKSAFNVILYGFVMNHVWNIGGKGLLGYSAGLTLMQLLFGFGGLGGDGDDDKDLLDKIVDTATYYGSVVYQGLPGAQIINDIIANRKVNIGLISPEIERVARMFEKAIENYGVISWETAYLLLNTATRFGGIDMDQLFYTYLAVEGALRDGKAKDYNDLPIDLMFLLKSPDSQRAVVAKQLYHVDNFDGMTDEEKQAAIDNYMSHVERAMLILDGVENESRIPLRRKLTEQKRNELLDEFRVSIRTEEDKEKEKQNKDFEERLGNANTSEELENLYNSLSNEAQKDKVRKKMGEQFKDASPAKTDYEKITEKQKKLNGETAKEKEPTKYDEYNKKKDGNTALVEEQFKAEFNRLKEIHDAYEELEEPEATQFYKEHQDELDRYTDMKIAQRIINKFKSHVDGSNTDNETIKDINKEYKDALGTR